MTEPTPITLVGGWFGAGKTRLVERLIEARPGEVAVVHAGAAPRPSATEAAWTTVEIEEEVVICSEDGCPCCAERLDLVVALTDLVRRRRPPGQVVVELGGDADVATVLQTLLRDPLLLTDTVVDGVVVVIDGPSTSLHIGPDGALDLHPVLQDQLAVADAIAIGRTERMTDAAAQRLRWTVHYANPRASVVELHPQSPVEALFHLAGFTPAGIAADGRSPSTSTSGHEAPAVIRLEVDGELDRSELSSWMDDLHHRRGTDLLRLHGVLAVAGEPARWVARGVRTTLDLDDGADWRAGEHRRSRLWLVGRHLDPHDLGLGLALCRTDRE